MFSVAQHLVLIRYSPGKTHLPCRYYCPFAKADAVIELLLSVRPLPAQHDLPEVTARLGTGDFQRSVLSMLSRDPAERPTVAQLFDGNKSDAGAHAGMKRTLWSPSGSHVAPQTRRLPACCARER